MANTSQDQSQKNAPRHRGGEVLQEVASEEASPLQQAQKAQAAAASKSVLDKLDIVGLHAKQAAEMAGRTDHSVVEVKKASDANFEAQMKGLNEVHKNLGAVVGGLTVNAQATKDGFVALGNTLGVIDSKADAILLGGEATRTLIDALGVTLGQIHAELLPPQPEGWLGRAALWVESLADGTLRVLKVVMVIALPFRIGAAAYTWNKNRMAANEAAKLPPAGPTSPN